MIPEFIQKINQTIDENRGHSMRSIERKLHVSEKTIRRSVHEDIWYKCYVMKRNQFISEKSKENCLNRSKRILNKLKILQKLEWFGFSQMKKNLIKTKKLTKEMTCSDPSDVLRIMCTKFPSCVKVLDILSNEGRFATTLFFLKALE